MGAFKFAKTVLGSLFQKPATLMYPVVPREWQERTRGAIDIDKDACILCGICSRKCPTKAITVDRKAGFWEIQRMQCIQCGECVAECPKDCLIMNPKYTEPDAEKIVDTVEVEVKKAAPKKEAKADDKAAAKAGDDDLTCNKETCIFCGLCVKECPVDAIKVDRKEKTWEVDLDACAKCGACIDKCPKDSLSFGEQAAPKAEDKPEEPAAAPASDDDDLVCDKSVCIFCGLCAKACPVEALTVDRKEKVWEVDTETCVKCGACLDKCPKNCLSFGEKPADDKAAEPVESKLPKLNEEECIYCRACENVCPSEAIVADVDDWKLDEDKCVGCAACVDACPADALEMK